MVTRWGSWKRQGVKTVSFEWSPWKNVYAMSRVGGFAEGVALGGESWAPSWICCVCVAFCGLSPDCPLGRWVVSQRKKKSLTDYPGRGAFLPVSALLPTPLLFNVSAWWIQCLVDGGHSKYVWKRNPFERRVVRSFGTKAKTRVREKRRWWLTVTSPKFESLETVISKRWRTSEGLVGFQVVETWSS